MLQFAALRKISVTISIPVLCALLATGCSKSSSGNGETPASKPDLKPATEVSQSFNIVKTAGQPSQNTAKMALNEFMLQSVQNNKSDQSQSSTKLDEKARVQMLKQTISDPASCSVKFTNPQPNSNGSSGTYTSGFNLKISGAKCPLAAEFNQNFNAAPSGSKLAMDYSFKVTDSSMHSIVGASEAKMKGSLETQVSSDGRSQTGQGQFNGLVNSHQYGAVSLKLDLKLEVTANQDRTFSGYETEVATFNFSDTNLNLNLTRTMTYDHNDGQTKPGVVCKANNALITEDEYEQIMGGFNSADNSKTN